MFPMKKCFEGFLSDTLPARQDTVVCISNIDISKLCVCTYMQIYIYVGKELH